MADDVTPKPKGGKLKKILLFGVVILVVVAATAATTFYFFGGTQQPAAAEDDPALPQLRPREDATDEQITAATRAARRGRVDPRVFQATYIPVTDNFTSNLKGGGAFVQIGLALSTYYDDQVVANVETHQLAIRSAVLMTLAEQDPVLITTTQGKEQLKQQLTVAINRVLEQREGFGGIDSVYFTSLVTQ